MTGTGDLTLTASVSINKGVLFQQLQDEGVLLNLDSGQYFGLDGIGTRIWNLLATGKSLPEIASTIVSEYEVGRTQCEADLLKLIGDLDAHGLVSSSR